MGAQRSGRRTNIREPRALALLAGSVVLLIATLTRAVWLDLALMAGYVVALFVFVVHQVRSYRETAKKFPIPRPVVALPSVVKEDQP